MTICVAGGDGGGQHLLHLHTRHLLHLRILTDPLLDRRRRGHEIVLVGLGGEQVVGMLLLEVDGVLGGAGHDGGAHRAGQALVQVVISVLGVVQGVGALLLASREIALQLTAVVPDFELHLHNVVHIAGVVRGHVVNQDGCEAELPLAGGTGGHLGVVILAQGLVQLKEVLIGQHLGHGRLGRLGWLLHSSRW